MLLNWLERHESHDVHCITNAHTANRQNCSRPNFKTEHTKCTKTNPAQWKLVMHATWKKGTGNNAPIEHWRREWIRKSQIVSNRNWLNFWFVRYRVRFSGWCYTLKKRCTFLAQKRKICNTHTHPHLNAQCMYKRCSVCLCWILKFICIGSFSFQSETGTWIHSAHDLCVDS